MATVLERLSLRLGAMEATTELEEFRWQDCQAV